MNKVVCGECLPDLAAFIGGRKFSGTCSYCGEPGSCATIEDVAERIQDCLCDEYDEAANHLPYCGAEGGYQGTTWTTIELLRDEVGLEVGPDCDDSVLLEDLARHIKDYTWCEKEWARLPLKDRLIYNWKNFAEVIKHKRRYTFWSVTNKQDPYDQDEVPAGLIFQELGKELARLVKSIQAGTEIWRIRIHDTCETFSGASDFASPPTEFAKQSNRMSPAGVSMFYGAENLTVAAEETPIDEGQAKTGARFRTAIQLQILDLASIPKSPGFFERERQDERRSLTFLHAFANEISRSIDKKNGCPEVEYAATQAFTEHIRWRMRTPPEYRPVDGICYRSSRGSGICYVLFCEHEQCIEDCSDRHGKRWLNFDATSVTRAL